MLSSLRGSEDDVGRLRIDLASLGSWTEKCQMMFNIGKCKVMNNGFKNRKEDYALNGVPLGSGQNQRREGFGCYYLAFAMISRLGNSVSKPPLRVTRCWG